MCIFYSDVMCTGLICDSTLESTQTFSYIQCLTWSAKGDGPQMVIGDQVKGYSKVRGVPFASGVGYVEGQCLSKKLGVLMARLSMSGRSLCRALLVFRLGVGLGY